jgi:hypothetical protein
MIRLAALFMVVAPSSGAISKAYVESAPAPKITIDYPGVIESNCKALGLNAGDASMVAELRARLPTWRAAWDKDGPRLLAELRRTVGKPELKNSAAQAFGAVGRSACGICAAKSRRRLP